SISQTSDGGYIVAGNTGSYGAGSYDYLIIKLDSSGNINNCSYVQSISPSSTSPTLSTSSITLTIFSPSLSSSSPSLSSSSPSLSSQKLCPSQ
ncbi:MAG: hypothetical protein ACK4Z6_09205, partial [Candidatus Methylomirabilales bacterium]